MTRFTAHSFAIFAAVLITVTSISTIMTVPQDQALTSHALTSMPILA